MTKLEECVVEAKLRIADTDWIGLSDITNLQNKDEFVAYRVTVRNYLLNPVENPTWPTKPTAIWS
jgi:hypothetical protein